MIIVPGGKILPAVSSIKATSIVEIVPAGEGREIQWKGLLAVRWFLGVPSEHLLEKRKPIT
jgi:hypothetical protein